MERVGPGWIFAPRRRGSAWIIWATAGSGEKTCMQCESLCSTRHMRFQKYCWFSFCARFHVFVQPALSPSQFTSRLEVHSGSGDPWGKDPGCPMGLSRPVHASYPSREVVHRLRALPLLPVSLLPGHSNTCCFLLL